MDYDQTDIATNYDKARALAPETRELWQHLLSAHIDRRAVSLIIDLGCGTGRFAELLATHFDARVIGIDPSRKMVDRARLKPATGNVVYRPGAAEALPLPDTAPISYSCRWFFITLPIGLQSRGSAAACCTKPATFAFAIPRARTIFRTATFSRRCGR
jgi:ubiquinone/menaquinone biosynthesis C-methylase UbiE